MMAEPAGWDAWAVAETRADNTDDIWHVAIAPDDVKVVSLEQLDDLFRLSLVDSETKVWQTGMREWLPLGVVAGLDDKPKAPAKRTHPPPPRPKSAPPPPPRRSAPVAAASFYPEPLAPVRAPVAFIAPVGPAIASLGSVRPLVVSHAPRRARRGGGFGRFVLWLAVLAGAGITAYRNDVVHEAAHALGRETLYARLEQALGGPSFGTLRAVEQGMSGGQGSATLTLSNATASGVNSRVTTPIANPAAVPSTPSAAASMPTPSTSPARSANAQPPVVSLESLAPEKPGVARSAPIAVAPPAAKSPAVSRASTPAAPAPAPKAAPVEKPAPAPKAAAVERPAPPPVPDKPEAEMTPRERLNAAIAKSMQTSPASSKKSAKSSTGLKGHGEYDPLNPKL